MAHVAKQTAEEGYKKAISYHVGPEYDETVEYVESELSKTGITYGACELLAEMIAAGGMLAGLHLRDFVESAMQVTHNDVEIDLLLDEHASEEVLNALEWIEEGDEIAARLETMALGWVREVIELTS